MEAIQIFHDTHNRFPTVRELDIDPSLPSHTRFERWVEMPYSEYLEKYCSTNKKECLHQKYIEAFVKWYHENHPVGFNDYENHRPKTCPHVATVMRIAKVKNWSELIKQLNLPSFSKCELNFIVKEVGGMQQLFADTERLQRQCNEIDEQFMREGRDYAYLRILYPEYRCTAKKKCKNRMEK